MRNWIARHPFLLLAVLLNAGLIALALAGGSYLTVSPEAGLLQGDAPPFNCQLGPFYDAGGLAHAAELPYAGLGPLYRVPGDALGVTAPDCVFPGVISPTQVTSWGSSYYPIYLDAKTPADWMRMGESTTLEAGVEIGQTFRGERSLDQEAIQWAPGDARLLTFSLSAPSFDFSPTNAEIRPQSLAIGRPVRQLWIIAPHGSVSGEQVISIKLEDPASGAQVTFAYLWLNVRHPTGFDTVTIALIAVTGLAVGWVLDRIKTVYEIRKMDSEIKTKPPAS